MVQKQAVYGLAVGNHCYNMLITIKSVLSVDKSWIGTSENGLSTLKGSNQVLSVF